MKLKRIILYSIISITFFAWGSIVQAVTGAIDTSATNTAKVCKSTDCTTPTPGIINFELMAQPSIVIDSVTGISGKVWGNELGWINFNPTGQGVTFADLSTGKLTGKAWSQVSGWINFGVTGQDVFINPTTGVFSGRAWTGGPYGGWLKFDCGDSSSCVQTTWKPIASGSPGGGSSGGGGGGRFPDVCLNIPNIQASIPPGYTVDLDGNCVVVSVDMCPNIAGEQTQVPIGYSTNAIGACIMNTIDFCVNLDGIQPSVPSGYIIDNDGDCVVRTSYDFCPDIKGIQTSYNECKKNIKDVCSNLPGMQSETPIGYRSNTDQCLPELFDVCPNMMGLQTDIPDDYTIGLEGDCIHLPEDFCNNLAGYQPKVPKGFKQEGPLCLFVGQTKIPEADIKIISFPFVPRNIFIVSDNPVIKNIIKTFDNILGTSLTEEPYRVDLVSVGLGGISLLVILLIFIKIVRFIFVRRP